MQVTRTDFAGSTGSVYGLSQAYLFFFLHPIIPFLSSLTTTALYPDKTPQSISSIRDKGQDKINPIICEEYTIITYTVKLLIKMSQLAPLLGGVFLE